MLAENTQTRDRSTEVALVNRVFVSAGLIDKLEIFRKVRHRITLQTTFTMPTELEEVHGLAR